MTLAVVQRVIICGAPLDLCRTTKASTPIAEIVSIVSRRLSPLLTLLDDTAKFMVSALSRFAAVSKLVRVRVESSKNKLTTFLPRSAGTFGMVRCEISAMWSVSSNRAWRSVAGEVGDRQEVLHAITTPSGLTRTSSSPARRQVLADVVGPDRQLAMAAVDDDGELHGVRPAVVVERVERGAHRAAGEEHVVDQHDGRARRATPGSR